MLNIHKCLQLVCILDKGKPLASKSREHNFRQPNHSTVSTITALWREGEGDNKKVLFTQWEDK